MNQQLKSLGCAYTYHNEPISMQKRTKSNTTSVSDNHPALACNTLAELKLALQNYDRCALKATALNTVFADGNPKAQVMLIGEAPGADEDTQGLPFVGQSGQLLNKILLSIGFKRQDVYIANIVPWRPPGNRTPTLDEISLCMPFIERHIELVNPKVLVFLGGISAKTLLKTQDGITKLRGKFLEYNTQSGHMIPCLATFHPAYLLRSPGQKAQVWHDMLRLKIYLQENT